jgi:hypothetical protein
LIKVELTFSEDGGEGVSEYVLRNISSNSVARNVRISTPGPPSDPDEGGSLVQEWAYRMNNDDEYSPYNSVAVIDEITAGDLVRLRTRVLAAGTSNPATHQGSVMIHYLRASV